MPERSAGNGVRAKKRNTAVIGGEKVRIAHGGMMDFDPRQSPHIHRWTTAMRPISRSDSFDRPRLGIGMLERF
jgi:hypothetical protein